MNRCLISINFRRPVNAVTLSRTIKVNSAFYYRPSAFFGTRLITTKNGLNTSGSDRPLKDIPSSSLINTLTVFWLCSFPSLVNQSMNILNLLPKLRLTPVSNFVIKNSFYKQFCAGETSNEVIRTINDLEKRNIGAILDMALEADVSDKVKSKEEILKESAKLTQEFIDCITIASKKPGSWIALKITALIPPEILQRFSNTFDAVHVEFLNLTNSKRISNGSFTKIPFLFTDLDKKIDIDQLKKLISTVSKKEISNQDEKLIEKLFNKADLDKDGKLDWIDLTSSIFTATNTDALFLFTVKSNIKGGDTPGNTTNRLEAFDVDIIKSILPNIYKLGDYIIEKNVRVFVDAEQTYLQRLIDDIGLILAKYVNGSKVISQYGPLISNTYQMYLNDGFERVKLDISRAKRFNYGLGFKMVRGAYMLQERELAEQYKYPDPIHKCKEDTTKQYNDGIKKLLNYVFDTTPSNELKKPFSLFIATHNNESVNLSLSYIFTKKESNDFENTLSTRIGFGTLYGMRDCMSNVIAKQPNIKIFKYLPYGSVDIVIPYLLRRAIENKEVISQVFKDTNASENLPNHYIKDLNDIVEIKKELKIRYKYF